MDLAKGKRKPGRACRQPANSSAFASQAKHKTAARRDLERHPALHLLANVGLVGGQSLACGGFKSNHSHTSDLIVFLMQAVGVVVGKAFIHFASPNLAHRANTA